MTAATTIRTTCPRDCYDAVWHADAMERRNNEF